MAKIIHKIKNPYPIGMKRGTFLHFFTKLTQSRLGDKTTYAYHTQIHIMDVIWH